MTGPRDLRTDAARELLASPPADPPQLHAALVQVEVESAAPYRAELGWALDLLDEYDLHLLEHGDDPMEVYSPDHIARRRLIRQMLDEEP